jgi:hypothetical protein
MKGVPASQKNVLQNLGGKYLQFAAGAFATPYNASGLHVGA